jgi:glutamine amidotransferase
VVKVTIIDMNMGNIQSVAEAFKRIGCEVLVSGFKSDIEDSSILVLPGVGAFGDGMKSLYEKGLLKALSETVIKDKKPLLGICVGMQLLSEKSNEFGEHEGLKFIDGKVHLLKPDIDGYRVPNMGWCDVIISKDSKIFNALPSGETFYFAHSYYFECDNSKNVSGYIEFSGKHIPCIVEKDNIVGVQFHPEKSQDIGLDFLETYIKYFS